MFFTLNYRNITTLSGIHHQVDRLPQLLQSASPQEEVFGILFNVVETSQALSLPDSQWGKFCRFHWMLQSLKAFSFGGGGGFTPD